LKAKLTQQEKNNRDAARAAARAELLLQEESGYLEAEGLEQTFKFRQDQLAPSLDANTTSKVYIKWKEQYLARHSSIGCFFFFFFFFLDLFT
jgi:hypothetical protein